MQSCKSTLATLRLVAFGAVLTIASASVLAANFSADPQNMWQSWQTGPEKVNTPQLRDGNIFRLTPAEVIYYSAMENRVNPVLLLAKIQHEQNLISVNYDDAELAWKLSRATGFGVYDPTPRQTQWSGFYPQLVAAGYQFGVLWRQRYKDFDAALAIYSKDRAAITKVKSVYAQYADVMNRITGRSYPLQPSGWGYVDNFLDIQPKDIQNFLNQYPTRLKNVNLFSGAAGSVPVYEAGQSGLEGNLASWQSKLVSALRPLAGTTDNVEGQCTPNGEYTWCYAWAWRRYRDILGISLNRYDNAALANENIKSKYPNSYTTSGNFASAPIGSLVFFDRHGSNKNSGHAAIKISRTEMINQGFGGPGDRCRVTINTPADVPAPMTGYFVPLATQHQAGPVSPADILATDFYPREIVVGSPVSFMAQTSAKVNSVEVVFDIQGAQSSIVLQNPSGDGVNWLFNNRSIGTAGQSALDFARPIWFVAKDASGRKLAESGAKTLIVRPSAAGPSAAVSVSAFGVNPTSPTAGQTATFSVQVSNRAGVSKAELFLTAGSGQPIVMEPYQTNWYVAQRRLTIVGANQGYQIRLTLTNGQSIVKSGTYTVAASSTTTGPGAGLPARIVAMGTNPRTGTVNGKMTFAVQLDNNQSVKQATLILPEQNFSVPLLAYESAPVYYRTFKISSVMVNRTYQIEILFTNGQKTTQSGQFSVLP